MKKFFQIVFCLLISVSVFAQEKKDSIVAKTKHKFSISLLGELNYSNDTKPSFKDVNSYEHSGYSLSLGVTINFPLNKYFSIGTGIINEQFSILYFGPTTIMNSQQNFFFMGFPLIPDFFYSWKRVSIHFIPEIRADYWGGDVIKYPGFGMSVEWEYSNKILLLACPKFGISYNIIHGLSISTYFGIKQTLSPISNEDRNSPWAGIKTSFYSITGGFGINYKL